MRLGGLPNHAQCNGWGPAQFSTPDWRVLNMSEALRYVKGLALSRSAFSRQRKGIWGWVKTFQGEINHPCERIRPQSRLETADRQQMRYGLGARRPVVSPSRWTQRPPKSTPQ